MVFFRPLDGSLGYETGKGQLPGAGAVWGSARLSRRLRGTDTTGNTGWGVLTQPRWGYAGSLWALPGPRLCRPAALPTRDERSEAEPGRGCVSLTSQPPRVGCGSPRERIVGKCHSGEASPLCSTPHIPWSFPAKRGLVPETGCPPSRAWPRDALSRCAQAQVSSWATPRTVPEVMLTHGRTDGRTQRRRAVVSMGCLVEGGGVC